MRSEVRMSEFVWVRLNTLTHHTTDTRFGKHRGRLVGAHPPIPPVDDPHVWDVCECVGDNSPAFLWYITYLNLIPTLHTFTQQPSQQHKTYKTHTFTRISAISVFHYFPMLSYVLLCFPMFHGMFFKRTNRNISFKRDVSSEKHSVNTYGFDNSLKEPMVL